MRTSASLNAGTAAPNAAISGCSPTNRPRAWSTSPTTTPGPSAAAPESSGSRPSIAASSVDLPEPLAPVIATRSAQSICRVTGPSTKSPRRTTASRRVATTAPARGAAAISIRSSHSLRGSSTTSMRSISRSVCRALAACFSEARDVERLAVLVVVGGLAAGVADALVGPGALHPGPFQQVLALVGELVELLAGVPPGPVPLLQVGGVTAAEEA